MPRRTSWTMSPGETLTLAKSLAGDLEDDDTLTGQTPEVTVWERQSSGTYEDVTTSAGFTVASPQVNTEALTTEAGETIAIGDGVVFRLTATETPGTYLVRVECDTDGGDHVVSDVTLQVSGSGVPE